MNKQKQGFTLVEIMTTVAIIALLAVMAVPSFMSARIRLIQNDCYNNLRLIDNTKDQYALDHSNNLPASLAELIDAGTYLKNTPTCRAGGIYRINSIGIKASCNVHGTAP